MGCRTITYAAFGLLLLFSVSCIAPAFGLTAVRQMQIGYALGCAGWIALLVLVWRRPLRAPSLRAILLIAALARLLLLPAPVSDDVHRYIWEGRVRLAGLNPYLHAPDDAALAHLRDENWAGINHRYHRAIYSPTAQCVFTATAALSPTPAAFKAVAVLADVATIALLIVWLRRRGDDPRRVLAYALCPATLSAVAREAHLDALMLPALAVMMISLDALRIRAGERSKPAARARWVMLSGAALGAAIGVKVVPLVLVPWWLARIMETPTEQSGARGAGAGVTAARGILALVVMLALPAVFYADAGVQIVAPLLSFATSFDNLSLPHGMIRSLVGNGWAQVISAGILTSVLLLLIKRRTDTASATLHMLGATLVLLPTIHPWYVTWMLPALCGRMTAVWAALCVTMVFGFEGDAMRAATGTWNMPGWVAYAVFVPLLPVLALEARYRRRRGALATKSQP